MKRLQVLLLGILLIVGTIGFMIYVAVSTRDYQPVEAKVVSMEYDPTYIPTDDDDQTPRYNAGLTYTVDGKEYRTEIQVREDEYKVGETVKIKYDPKNPESISVGEMPLALMIGIGIVAFLLGAGVIIKGLRM